MDIVEIRSDKVPPGPAYSQAIRAGNLLFIAGQVGRDAKGNLVGKGDVVAQARQAMENVGELLKAAGAGWANVVKTNIYVTDMSQREGINAVRKQYLKEPWPVSTMVEVKGLARPEFLFEIEAEAVL